MQYAAQLANVTHQSVPGDAHRLVREADLATGRLTEGMPAAVAMLPTVRPLQRALLQFQVGAPLSTVEVVAARRPWAC